MASCDWLVSLMRESAVPPDRLTFNARLKAAFVTRDGVRAVQIWREMKEANVMPDGFSVSVSGGKSSRQILSSAL